MYTFVYLIYTVHYNYNDQFQYETFFLSVSIYFDQTANIST